MIMNDNASDVDNDDLLHCIVQRLVGLSSFGSFCDAFVSLVNNSTVQSLLYSVQ